MPRRDDSIFETLTELPWWVSVIVACLVSVALRFFLPGVFKGPIFSGLAQRVSSNAIWIVLFFLLPGTIAALAAWRRGELLKGQTSIASIRRLPWRNLEDLANSWRQVLPCHFSSCYIHPARLRSNSSIRPKRSPP